MYDSSVPTSNMSPLTVYVFNTPASDSMGKTFLSKEQGISRLPNPPYSLNKDYRQVYNIPADSTGTAGLDNEGAVAIYRRTNEGNYNRFIILVSEHRKANRGFGKKVKIEY